MPRARRFHRQLLFLVIAACAREGVAPGVPDSTYVASWAALIRINADTTQGAAAKAAARQAVLQQRGLTSAQFERWVRDLAEDPARATDVAAALQRKVQEAAPPVRTRK